MVTPAWSLFPLPRKVCILGQEEVPNIRGGWVIVCFAPGNERTHGAFLYYTASHAGKSWGRDIQTKNRGYLRPSWIILGEPPTYFGGPDPQTALSRA